MRVSELDRNTSWSRVHSAGFVPDDGEILDGCTRATVQRCGGLSRVRRTASRALTGSGRIRQSGAEVPLSQRWSCNQSASDMLTTAPIKMRQFIFTHTSGPVPRHAVLGVGGCPITRGRGSARGLVQCRRGRTAEQREPVVDPLSGQTLMGAGPLVPSPAPCAQIEPGTEQVEKALGSALVHVEIGA